MCSEFAVVFIGAGFYSVGKSGAYLRGYDTPISTFI